MRKIYVMGATALSAVFLLVILFSGSAQAQTTETLFSDDVTHGGFGGPVVKIGEVAGSTGVWFGGRGGWIINLDHDHAISLGGAGYGLVTNHSTPIDNDLFALNGYGGFDIEYHYSTH